MPGITNVNLPEAEMKRKMVAAAQRTVVVADGSKLGNISVAKIADLSDIDQLITGPSAPPEVVAELASRGVAVEIAESRITGTTRSHCSGGQWRKHMMRKLVLLFAALALVFAACGDSG